MSILGRARLAKLDECVRSWAWHAAGACPCTGGEGVDIGCPCVPGPARSSSIPRSSPRRADSCLDVLGWNDVDRLCPGLHRRPARVQRRPGPSSRSSSGSRSMPGRPRRTAFATMRTATLQCWHSSRGWHEPDLAGLCDNHRRLRPPGPGRAGEIDEVWLFGFSLLPASTNRSWSGPAPSGATRRPCPHRRGSAAALSSWASTTSATSARCWRALATASSRTWSTPGAETGEAQPVGAVHPLRQDRARPGQLRLRSTLRPTAPATMTGATRGPCPATATTGSPFPISRGWSGR